jgi:hypothetical protein
MGVVTSQVVPDQGFGDTLRHRPGTVGGDKDVSGSIE